jgi:hypothetical protein
MSAKIAVRVELFILLAAMGLFFRVIEKMGYELSPTAISVGVAYTAAIFVMEKK